MTVCKETKVKKSLSLSPGARFITKVPLLPSLRQSRVYLGSFVANFSSSRSSDSHTSDIMTENDFHKQADASLEEILEVLEILDDTMDDADINYAMGVLTIDLGVVGTWVLNKQTPNRQIWWSSPVSGPRRFELTVIDKEVINEREEESNMIASNIWVCTKTGGKLGHEIVTEIENASNTKISHQALSSSS